MSAEQGDIAVIREALDEREYADATYESANAALDRLAVALERAERDLRWEKDEHDQARTEWLVMREERDEALALLAQFRPDIERADKAERALGEAQERLSHIRPLRDSEWAVLMREHDVLHEARRLSESVGWINTTAKLDRALERYEEAVKEDDRARDALHPEEASDE